MKNKLSFLEPWNIGVRERTRILSEARARGKKIALYFAEFPESSTFRYRCYNTMQITSKSDVWQAVYFFADEKNLVEELLEKVDLFVVARHSGHYEIAEELIFRAKKLKVPVVLDIDDLVFDLKYLYMVLNTIGQLKGRNYWERVFNNNHKIAQKMDGFLVTNDFLGEKLSKDFDKPYKVIRNSLNDEQLAASRVYLEFKPEDRDVFKIGYFSGSPTHMNDLMVAMPEVVEFLKKYPKAQLLVAGSMEFGMEVEPCLKSGQIGFLSHVDFRKLQRLMSEVDVNIAPLVINDFTNCKSELKFFEAAAVETTTIASPTYTFRKAIDDGKNGFLAKPGEWYDKLEYLYKNSKENKKMAKKAKEYALKHYTGIEFMREVEAAYDFFGDF